MPDLSILTNILKKINPLPALANGGEIAANPAAPKMETADALPPGPYANLRKEAAFREKFPDTPLQFRQYDDPITQAKYDSVYGEPMAAGKTLGSIEHPGFKGRMMQGLKEGWKGLSTGQGQGFLGGTIDPAGSQERVFDLGEGAQMRAHQGQEMERQGALAKMAEIMARIQHQRQTDNIAERGMVLKEKEFGQPEWMSPVSVDQNGNPVLLQTNRKGKEFRVLGGDAGILNQNARAEADRKARADIAQGAQAVQVYKHNNPNTASGGNEQQAATLEKKWATARKRANDETLTQEERNAAYNEAEAAAAEIKQKYGHLYDTDGQGGWSYVRRKQAGAQGEVDVERYVGDAIKAGATREQALQHLRDRGYKVP